MTSTQPSFEPPGHLLALSAELNGAKTIETAVTRTFELVELVFDQPVTSVCAYDSATDTVTTLGSSVPSSVRVDCATDQIPDSLLERTCELGDNMLVDGTPEAVVEADPQEPIQIEVLVPVGRNRVLRVGVTEHERLDETEIATIEGIAANLETALSRIDHWQSGTVGCDTARALFEQSEDATFITDTDGTLLAVNRAAVELTGRDRNALLQNGLQDIFGDTAVEAVREHLDSSVHGASQPLTATLESTHEGDTTVVLKSQQVNVDGTSYIRTTSHDPPPNVVPKPERPEGSVEDDATALRQLSKLTVGANGFDETIERLLSLGCDHFSLDTGILSHIDGDDYEVDTVVDATGTHETGAVYDLGETMCDVTLASDGNKSLAFADVKDTDYQNHPAAKSIRAYIAAPVVVDGRIYGTVNFSMDSPRAEAFRSEQKEFVELVAEWIGTEIERRHRSEELERYETILEAIDDPVYALDTRGRFNYVNEAAKEEFGYGEEIIGEHPSIAMNESDVETVQEQIEDLIGTDKRSTTAEFELETVDGERRLVENRLAVIGKTGFEGTAGVLRDVTDREQRRQQLESFQQAIEEAADGVAILEGNEYVYVDQAHVDMYGLDAKDQLLGDTWQKLYDDNEVERLEAEAFPALESEGYWRGKVTGSRPDGTTFPAELSLTIVDDGRLVCTVRDETERQERERELKSFQRAIESSRDGVAILDGDEYEYVDQSHVDMYGFEDKGQLLGNTWRKLYDDHEVERLEAEAFPALKSEGYWRGMVTGTRPDGSTFPAELSLTIVDDGRLVCTVRDETERRKRERELELKERAMDEANVGIQITDPTQEDNPLVYVNSGFERMTGYAREDALGRNPRFLQGEDSNSEQVTQLREAISTEEPVSLELQNERKNGTSYWSRLSVTPVTDESGTVRNYIGIQQDITERRERERQTEARKDFLKRIYEVTTDPELTFSEKITGLLEAGRDHLDLPYGFLTHIEKDDEEGDGIQTVVEALGSHELLQPGESAPLEQSYCRKTIEQGGSMDLTNTDVAGWADDPAYETFGLETYIGTEVVAGGDLYGTMCFASKEPREHTFDEFEKSFIRLAGRWIGYEINRQNSRQELREQRERLELTLSGTNTGLAEWNLETDAVTWNETLVDIVERDIDSLEEFRTAIHPDDRNRVQQELETMVETGDPWVGEFRMLDDDGDALWLGTRATPVSNDGGEPVRVLATGTDISRQKEAERERRRNERRFESLFDDPGMLVGLLDTDGQLLDANGTAMEYVDTTAEELRGEPFWKTPWWTHSEEQQADLREWIQRAASGEYVEYTATHPGPDGNQRDVMGAVRPVTDESETVRSVLVTGRDVTEREQRRRELRNRQQKLDLVLSNTDTSIVESNLSDGVLNWANMFGSNNTGSPETLEAFLETAHPDDRERLQSDLEAMIDSGESVDSEYRFIDQDNETMWITAQAVPVDDEGKNGGQAEKIVGIWTDITDLKQRQQKLFKERERFRLLTESVDEYAFLVVDGEGVIQTWNQSAEHTFGYNAEAAIGMSMSELHPEADREQNLPDRLLQQARVAGESAHEGWHVRADGSKFYADVRYAPLDATNGEIDGYAVIARDMTDRRREQRRTERFVEKSNDVVTVLDTEGTITYASGSAERVLGYDPDDIVGENLFDYLHPDSREHAMQTFYDCVGGTKHAQAECRLRAPDGGWFNIEGRCRNMLDDDAIDGVLVYLRDVTETRERTRRFESIFNGTFQLTGLLEPDGTVVEVNEAALEFGGFKRNDIVGESLPDAPYWTHSEVTRKDVQDAIDRAAGGEFVRYETEIRGANGLATFDFSVKPVTDQDDDVSLLVVEGRDITALQRHKSHLEVMQRVMRHNMRNDLTKMRGWTEMMCKETDEKKRTEKFETVAQILDNWEAMTEKMREIRTVLESQESRETRLEAGALVEDAVAPVREEYAGRTIVTDVSEPELQVPATLLEAVRELVENAAKVSTATATIKVEVDRSAADWIEVFIRDDGPGMPDMEADVLETGEETPLNHGQGLGLWMVRMIVTQAGGDVSVEAGDGGTDVCLRLPAKRTAESRLPTTTTT